MGFENFFATRLGADIGSSDTTLTLDTVPTVTSGRLALEARNPTQREIISYLGVAGNTITGVTRGQGGTTAKPHIKNSLVEMNLTAEDLNEALALAFAFPTGIVMPFAASIIPAGWLNANGQAVSRATYAVLFTAISTTFGAGDGSTTFNVPDMRSRIPLGIGAGTFTSVFANTDVTIATDLITVPTNTTLQTGQAVVLSGTGAAPTGLTHGTTYYVVRQSATTIKLATSLANALVGTAIDITGQGTGTNTLTQTLTNNALGSKGGEETHALTIAETPVHNHPHDHNFEGQVNKRYVTPDVNTGVSAGTGAAVWGALTMDDNAASAGGSGSHNIIQPFLGLNYIIKT